MYCVAGDHHTLALPPFTISGGGILLVNENFIKVELSLNALLQLVKHLGQCLLVFH